MTARNLSRQQKTILVALEKLQDFGKEFSVLHKFVLLVTGVDTWELEQQNRQFYRNRGHGPNSWRKREANARPIYDTNRLKSNKAFATVSRSIARLAERGGTGAGIRHLGASLGRRHPRSLRRVLPLAP